MLNLPEYLLLFISYIIVVITLFNLSKTKPKINLINILVVIITFIVHFIASYNNNGLIRSFTILIVYVLVVKIVCNKDIKKSYVISFIEYTLIILSEIFITLMVSIFMNPDNFIKLDNFSFLKILISILVALAPYLLLVISKKFAKVIDGIINFLNKSKAFIFISILSFILLELYTLRYIYKTDLANHNMAFVIILLIAVIFICFLIIELYAKKVLEGKNEDLTNMNLNYLKIINTDKIYRHNIKHQLNAILSVGNKKTKELIKEYQKEYNLEYGNIDDISKVPYGMQGIIYQKVIESKKYNLNITVDNFIKDIDNLETNSKLYNIASQAIGIMFDNAIEAAPNNPNSYIHLILDECVDEYIFKMYNNFDKEINLDKLGELGYTLKEKHQGVGLNYLIENKQLDTKIILKDNQFMVCVKLKK